MHKASLRMLSAVLLVVAFGFSCSKKPAEPTAELPKDGVTGIPAPAERAADLTPFDTPLTGTVKEVKVKVIDKAADDATKGLLRIKVLALDGPVDVSDNTHMEIWKPGSDTEEQKAEMNTWASREEAVTAGTWDVRLIYDEGNLCKVEGWVRNVPIAAGKLWKAEVVMAAPMQYVRVFGTLKGDDVADNMHVDLFKAGTDQEEFQPIASFWSTQKQAIAAGQYDLRLAYDKDNVKAKGSAKNFTVGSNHGILKQTFALNKE